jgi:hypothetical protein
LNNKYYLKKISEKKYEDVINVCVKTSETMWRK